MPCYLLSHGNFQMHVQVLINYIRMALDQTYKTIYAVQNTTQPDATAYRQHSQSPLSIISAANFCVITIYVVHCMATKKRTDPKQAYIIFLSMFYNSEHYNGSLMQILLYNIFVSGKILHWWLSRRHEDTTPGKKHRSETKMYACILKWYLHFAGGWCQLHLRKGENTKLLQDKVWVLCMTSTTNIYWSSDVK